MHTMSGKAVDLRNFTPDMVDIQDIALGLSRTCRFNGQVNTTFTVLEHSLIGSMLADTPARKLEALLHDAGEAYTGDIILPMKECFPEMAKFEDKITAVIFDTLYPNSGCIYDGMYIKSNFMAELDRNMAAWESYEFRPHLAFTHNTWSTKGRWQKAYKDLPERQNQLEEFINTYRNLITDIQIKIEWRRANGY